MYIEANKHKGNIMHGQQTLKHLNDKAVADSILAKAKHELDKLNPALEKAFQEYMADKAKNIVA